MRKRSENVSFQGRTQGIIHRLSVIWSPWHPFRLAFHAGWGDRQPGFICSAVVGLGGAAAVAVAVDGAPEKFENLI